MLKPEDYLLFMFSMKGLGKRVPFEHIKEKVTRDLGKIADSTLRQIVNSLLQKKLLEEVKGQYGITKQGKEFFAKKFASLKKELEKVNRPWLIVYQAKNYYPEVAETVLEFCKNRYTGFYCLFTEQRFFRRDFRGKKIVLRNVKDLMFFVNMHYIDVIPCVHRIGVERPDWLVVDIDAGPKVSWEQTKEVAELVYRKFEEFGLNPALKFSGGRGFQVWSWINEFELPENYQPLQLKGERKRERNYFSLFADFIRIIQREVDEELPRLTTSIIAEKESREDKVLLDPSSMKPMGLVRAPYGVHSKTGLVSLPVSIKELKKFEPGDACVEKTLQRYRKKGNEFILQKASPEKILAAF